MVSALRLIALAVLLQSSLAFVEFNKSVLYDETDFAQAQVTINFCVVGCRIYASVPKASADVAKQIMMSDETQGHEHQSLYDISKMTNGAEKGFYQVQDKNMQVYITNNNPNLATAPMAVWVVRSDADNNGEGEVYDAAALPKVPDYLGVVTVMSAEPFTLRSKTDGPMIMVSTLSGYDAVTTDGGNECTNVFEQLDPDTYSDVQVNVRSPFISFFFDNIDYVATKISLTATIGSDKPLDFSGVSFVASPGYIGCKGGETFRSSLYGAETKYQYSRNSRAYDVAFTSILSNDDAHSVTIKDIKNDNEYLLSEDSPDFVKDFSVQQTSSLEISWTKNDADLDQAFLIRLTPSNEQIFAPDPTTTESAPDPTTTDSESTTTRGTDGTDGTTSAEPDHPVDPDHTEPEAPKTTRRTTSQKPTTTTTHPKDVTSTTTVPTTPTTTSGAAAYGSTLVAITVASVFLH